MQKIEAAVSDVNQDDEQSDESMHDVREEGEEGSERGSEGGSEGGHVWQNAIYSKCSRMLYTAYCGGSTWSSS